MADAVIDLVEAARARGVAVTADQYPYPAGSTTLAVTAPPELREGNRVAKRFCSGDGRATLREGVARYLESTVGPEAIVVSVYPWRWWWQGRTLGDLARERGQDPVELAMDLGCGWLGIGIYFSQREEDVRRLMQPDWVATASDGAATPRLVGRYAHPRLYGTFPRKLRRYAIDEPVVPLAAALRSMTSLPADILGLRGRGRLAAGAPADVVVLDPNGLRDLASFERSGEYSEGVVHLFVNGVQVIEDGAYTGARGGRALRLGRDGGRQAVGR